MRLNESNYHSPEANRAYMSASQLKSFMDCPARTIAELRGEYKREDTTALLVGSFVDAFFSFSLDGFIANHPEVYTKTGTLRAEYQQAGEICRAVGNDPLLMAMLQGESQRIVTGEIAGVPFKGKLDSLLSAEQCEAIVDRFPGMADTLLMAPGAIVDLKCMKSLDAVFMPGGGRQSMVTAWRYDLQMACYRALVGGNLPCFLVVATKEKVPDRALIHLPPYMMQSALDSVLDLIPQFQAMKERPETAPRCEHCDFCRSTKVTTGAVDADEMDGTGL